MSPAEIRSDPAVVAIERARNEISQTHRQLLALVADGNEDLIPRMQALGDVIAALQTAVRIAQWAAEVK